MENLAKYLVGTLAAGAMAVSAATPAAARDRDHDGISAGEIVAGAVVLGGIAAIAAAASDNDRDRYDGYNGRYDGRNDGRYARPGYGPGYGYVNGYNRGWNGYGVSPREAINKCVSAATGTASRYSYGSRARVTDIRDIDRTSYGYEVRGRIAVNSMGRGWRSGDNSYGRGWDRDYRGWNSDLRGYDAGSFKCKIAYGRVADLDFNGIRGL